MLANNTFKYQITLSNETILLITVLAPYVFNLSTHLQYNDIKFKGLLIDSGASIQSTRSISQLKVLQQLDIFIQFNKNIAGLANFIFRIGSTALIRSVNLNISLRSIIFHIVSVSTSFLLYLADIDKLRAFFNNITNEVIQSQIQPT